MNRIVLSTAWSHGFCQWLVARHGIRVVSCSECLETERSSGRPIGTISKCYETCLRWWCDSGALWQWVGKAVQLCFRGRISRRARGMMKGSYARRRILHRAKAVKIWYVGDAKTWRRLGFRLVQKLTCQGSARCNRQLLNAIASVMGRWELFLCAKHVIWDRYEMQRKYFGWVETYGWSWRSHVQVRTWVSGEKTDLELF